jgi:hypothetical protein
MGQDQFGYRWLGAYDGNTMLMQPIFWRDGDAPDRFKLLAEQVRGQAKSELEMIERWQIGLEIHHLQEQAYQAIAEVLETGETTTVTIIPLERPILPEEPTP